MSQGIFNWGAHDTGGSIFNWDSNSIIPDYEFQQFTGYYTLSSAYNNGGAATDTTIPVESVDTWVNLNFTVDSVVDKRPVEMVNANADPYDPVAKLFSLEGLTTAAFGVLVPSLSFDPDEDNGEISGRILFTSHSGVTPATYSVETVIGSMAQGADEDYLFQPSLQFPITELIDTNATGDGGFACFQIKTSVAGTLSLREQTYYLHGA